MYSIQDFIKDEQISSDIIKESVLKQIWPFEEVEKLYRERLKSQKPIKNYVLFEMGYGPSGMPHIGTFGEAVRTSILTKLFERCYKINTKLLCVSDDMDGMRKIPDTIPNKEEYKKFLNLPLSKIPDPFGNEKSYAHSMNKILRNFLDRFSFKYEFLSATEAYKSGLFNEKLSEVLLKYEEIMEVMLKTLGEDRRATYSPFMPICKRTGKVLQVNTNSINIEKESITYTDPETNEIIETKVLDGNCKLQWKPDFGMRWAALNVDFEMYGKDHLVNGIIYSKICNILGGNAPQQMYFELFLDQNGEKISKSKGNGITLEDWCKYSPLEVLTYVMYIHPTKAKKLYLYGIQKYTNDYINLISCELDNLLNGNLDVQRPVFYTLLIHEFDSSISPFVYKGKFSDIERDIYYFFFKNITYTLLVNIINLYNINEDSLQVLLMYLYKYLSSNLPGVSFETFSEIIKKSNFINQLIIGAINFFQDLESQYKNKKKPNEQEVLQLTELVKRLSEIKDDQLTNDANYIQNIVYSIGKEMDLNLKEWFALIYQVMIGSDNGPRVGTFFSFLGLNNAIKIISDILTDSESCTISKKI